MQLREGQPSSQAALAISGLLQRQKASRRPSWLEIDLERLTANVAEVRRVVGRERKLIAVVKTDAYGHGLAVAPLMAEAGADVLAVGDLNDAILLREAGVTAPILLFISSVPAEIAEHVVRYNVIPTIWDADVHTRTRRRLIVRSRCG